MEKIQSSSEQLLGALSHIPYMYLPRQVCEAMNALRLALRGNPLNVVNTAKELITSIDEVTEKIPHNVETYVENLNSALLSVA